MTVSPALAEMKSTPKRKRATQTPKKLNPASALRAPRGFESSVKSRNSKIDELKSNKSPPRKGYKPVVKKTLKDFLKNCKKLLDQDKFENVKVQMESAIRNKTFGEIPQDAHLYLYCGIANLKLGYLIIAE